MTAPAPSPLRGALKFVRHIVVGANRGRGEMPNTSVRLAIAQYGSDCPMRDLTPAERCGLVDSSTHQRVPKDKPIAVDVHDACQLCRLKGCWVDTQRGGRAHRDCGVAGSLGSRNEQQGQRVLW